MTRRRRVPLVLRVCIGLCLVLSSAIAADTVKGPAINLEALGTDGSEPSGPEGNKTALNKIPSTNEADVVSPESDKGAIDSYNSTKKDLERVPGELGKDAEAEDEEKVAIPIDKDFKVQGDRSSTSDSPNGGSRFEETLYGTSGKSTSTKTVSEDFSRLSRTNDLTTVTAKPSSSEESKLDDKRNKTGSVEDTGYHEPNKTAKSPESAEEYETDTTKEELGHLSKESSVNSAPRSGMTEFADETATQKAFLERRKKAEGLSVKNSEVPDLEVADDKKTDGPISLINDTYVNYSRYYKTSTTEKSLEADSGNQSRAHENATNFISEDSAVTHEPLDPKGEVEVVGNVTHESIQRIVKQQSEESTAKDAGPDESVRDRVAVSNSTKPVETGHVLEGMNERNQETLTEVTTDRPKNEEASTVQSVSSPVPRGRTIGFSDINEFPNLETKPTLASKMDVLISKKNTSAEKLAEQKPYPYTKSSKEQFRNSSATTEETSALENTIGRGHEEMYIDTERSVVIENSIQQFKPTFYEKPDNESSGNATTEPRSSVPLTTMSLALEDARPTNQTVVDEPNDAKTIGDEKSSGTGNDVPRGSEVITEKGNFDVTGNGITEVSLKAENADKRTYEPSFRDIANRTTAAPLPTGSTDEPRADVGMLSTADVQTKPEGSLLIRSTLNATELSTEYPLIKGNFSQTESPTGSPVDTSSVKITDVPTVLPVTSLEEITAENVTESPGTPDANGTNEIPSGGGIEPNETSAPTTIEYEFVGLSETTTLPDLNVTEDTLLERKPFSAVTTVPTGQDSSTILDEGTTISPEMATDGSAPSGEAETTDVEGLSTVPVTDQTTVPTSMPAATVQSIEEFTTPSIVEEETEQTSTIKDDGERTTDSWTTLSEEDVGTTVATEYPVSQPGENDSPLVSNVTEAPMVPTLTSNVTAPGVTETVTSSPIAPSTLHPRILESSTPNTRTESDVPVQTTGDTKVSTSAEEITSLVRIVMDGNWNDVCQHRESLRSTLAEILRIGLNRSVDARQIIFHPDPECPEPPSSTPTPSDMPLTSILVYVVDENGKFNSTMTNIMPTLYSDYRDRVKFPVTIHSFLLVQETVPDSGNAIAVVVVSSVAFICLVLLAGLLFIMRKRQTRFNYGERCRPVSLDAYSLDSVSAYNSVRRKGVARSSKRSYGNPTFEDSSAIPSHPLNFAGLSSFCNDVNAINEEFAGIPQVSAKIDELPAGAELKNRYANVIPLPETRVPLQKINNDPLSEYINASYVRGPKNATRYYIACQAPMEATVTDFWRMIWEQQSKVIIMLTDLVENGVEKCTEYIPPSEITDCHRLYGDHQVTLKKRETKEKYAISTLHLKNLENNTFREVYHIWYLWPVNGAQSDGAGLIAVLLEARALQRGGPGPIVVHCSPGTGRTGTLIALDLGIRQYEITRTVDVPRVVYTIRRDRAGAVQTKEQYAFIYKALNLYATKLAGGVLEST